MSTLRSLHWSLVPDACCIAAGLELVTDRTHTLEGLEAVVCVVTVVIDFGTRCSVAVGTELTDRVSGEDG